MSRTRYFDLAAIVLAVAVITGLGFALRPQETAATAVDPATVHVDRPQPEAAHPSVLLIGDSYTAGIDLPEMSYGCMAAARLGWVCRLSAVPGTGYISGGSANRFTVDSYIGESTSFDERIPHLAQQYRPDVVVVDGGRNDLFPPKADVFKAMLGTIEEARRAWPQATIVFVRPRFLGRPADDLGFDDAFMRRLQTQPGAKGVVFIDPIKKFAGSKTADLLSHDGIHPNKRGEQEISLAFQQALVASGLTTTK